MAAKNQCIACGADAEYSFRALEVQTLPLREMTGERKVQALGRFTEGAVCRDCAMRGLSDKLSIARTVRRDVLVYGGILLAGILVVLIFLSRVRVIGLVGFAAIVCGCLGIYQAFGNAIRHKREAEALPEEEALAEAAWEVFLRKAPAKTGDSDLTYIPLTPKTLAMKNGDLMIAYDLVPELAVKAWDLIHGKGDGPGVLPEKKI